MEQRSILHLAAAGIVAVTSLTVLPSAHATYPGSQAGRLVFGVDLDPSGASPDIFSVLPNGRALHQLTSGPASDICPSWSADGKEIAFCSNRTGTSELNSTWQIWTMKHNGTQLRQVTNLSVNALFPDFSPAGDRIAFMAGQGPDVDIHVVDRRTGATTRLTTTPGFDGYPAWSPDGSRIAFISARPGISDTGAPQSGVPQVWVMDADGTDPVQLTHDAAPKGQLPDWSPDGTRIAYQSVGTGNGDIYVIDADGSDRKQLTSTSEQEFGPAWSPDGRQIAFVRVFGGGLLDRSIYVMDADGSDAHAIAAGSRVPTWQARGDRKAAKGTGH